MEWELAKTAREGLDARGNRTIGITDFKVLRAGVDAEDTIYELRDWFGFEICEGQHDPIDHRDAVSILWYLRNNPSNLALLSGRAVFVDSFMGASRAFFENEADAVLWRRASLGQHNVESIYDRLREELAVYD